MGGAFLAGLLAAGVAIFLPGRGDREQGPVSSSFAPPSPLPQPVSPPAGPSLASRLAIVVDDLGYEPSLDAEWLKLPGKATVAVLPFGPSSRKVAESARARGWGVILHVPMEPESPASDRTERFRIRRGMSGEEIESLLNRMAESLPQATGASNHMGSAATSDPATMAAFASALKKRGLYLLDSMTTPRSVALDAARNAGIPAARRDVFLDPGFSPEEMRRQWDQAVAIAREKGAAVLICHGKAETLRMIVDLLPRLKEENVEAVTLDELLRAGKEA
ncbi:MAG: divergent polysaccharide deacetylase family protein [Deltaproteobacteria bacterium]|nr:divergent polysaccharide deacetylase family protein [Deltaproteobacteria bacterium]